MLENSFPKEINDPPKVICHVSYKWNDAPERLAKFHEILRRQFRGHQATTSTHVLYTAIPSADLKTTIENLGFNVKVMEVYPIERKEDIVSECDLSEWLQGKQAASEIQLSAIYVNGIRL